MTRSPTAPHATWAPDSKRIAVVNAPRGIPELSIVAVDGSGSRPTSNSPACAPTDILWRPPDGHELLVRAIKHRSFESTSRRTADQFHIVDVDGPSPDAGRSVGIDPHDNFGPDWDNSGPSGHPMGARSTTTSWTRRRATGRAAFGSIASAPTALMTSRHAGTRAKGERGVADPVAGWQVAPRRALHVGGGAGSASDSAVLPTDGSAPAHEVGPKVDDGKDV